LSSVIKLVSFALAALCLLSVASCKKADQSRNRLDENGFPKTILWAWERPEDLQFLDPNQIGVAFLAQTLVLKGADVVFKPRLQPLKVRPETKLIAVTRIESQKTTGSPSALTASQREQLTERIVRTLHLGNVSAVQVDFDAATSEREFYRRLLTDLRQKLPDNVPLSMTALASFCIGDRWLSDLSVDEAVPMIFRMGADDQSIKTALASGNDFREPVCRKSYGVSLDEPLEMKFDPARRLYFFNARAWTQEDVEKIHRLHSF
jgi:hypothetical protein